MSEEKKKKKIKYKDRPRGEIPEFNFFQKKLEITRDNLKWTEIRIKETEDKIIAAEKNFLTTKEHFNNQIIHMQKIMVAAKKRIENYEKKVKAGYVAIDMKTGKAYKKKAALERHLISKKSPKVDPPKSTEEEEYIGFEKPKFVKKDPVKRYKKVKTQEEKKEEWDRINEERKKKIAAKKAAAQKLLKDAAAARKIELTKDKVPHIDIVKTNNDDLDKARSVSQQIGQVKDEINGLIKEMEWLLTMHQDWILEYNQDEGGKAIHAGRITNGFRSWCKDKNYVIGE